MVRELEENTKTLESRQVPYELASVPVPTDFVVVTEMVWVAPMPEGTRAAIDDSDCQNVASDAVWALRTCEQLWVSRSSPGARLAMMKKKKDQIMRINSLTRLNYPSGVVLWPESVSNGSERDSPG